MLILTVYDQNFFLKLFPGSYKAPKPPFKNLKISIPVSWPRKIFFSSFYIYIYGHNCFKCKPCRSGQLIDREFHTLTKIHPRYGLVNVQNVSKPSMQNRSVIILQSKFPLFQIFRHRRNSLFLWKM